MADLFDMTETQLVSFAPRGHNNEIEWAKAVHDGLRVRLQRGTETDWTDLGTDMNPPFVENRAPLLA